MKKAWLKWNMRAKARLEGKTIRQVRYMTGGEAESLGWWQRGVVFSLNDGTHVVIQQDDEGNGPGAMLLLDRRGDWEVLPTLLTEEG